jgi:hypothetical protein
VTLACALTVGALAGCSGTDPDALPAMPFDTVAMPAETAATATPGQQLATGEIIALPQTDYDGTPDDTIETTVIGVAQGDASYWDSFDNGEEFAGETPFFAVIQYRWVTGDVSAAGTPLLRPLLEDGSEGSIVKREYFGSMTANSACPFEIGRFDLEDDRGPNEYIACVVYTAPEGSTVASLAWHNVGELAFSEPDPEVNPFYLDPVSWTVTPIQPK